VKGDWLLLAAVLLLVCIGMVFIYSASCYTAEKTYGDAFFFVKKQAVGAVFGLIGMGVMMKINVDKLRKFAIPLMLVSYVLLALVFVPGIGVENYGAKRWISLAGQSFQPSELAKFAFVLFAAWYMSRKDFYGKSVWGYLPVLIVGGLTCLLIIAEPNMSMTVCVGLIMMCMLYAGGLKGKVFLGLFAVALLMIPVLIIMEPYRLLRLMAFLDPFASPKEEGYQLIQSLYALGSGGWFGVGLFNSRQKYKFLPFAESDFIFSVIGEEIGFVGAVLVLAVFVFVVIRGVRAAVNAENRFQALLAGGISCVIAAQTLINVAVVTGSIPPTGIPLPFISSGGSALTVFMTAAGILVNIGGKRKEHKKTHGVRYGESRA